MSTAVILRSVLSLLLWLAVRGQDDDGSGGEEDLCRMVIRVYETRQQCTSVQPHSSIGYFYPDGQCRSIAHDTPLDATVVYLGEPGAPADLSAYNLFPGNYRAECTSDGTVRFLESGCVSDDCAPPASATPYNNDCERNVSSIAEAYSEDSSSVVSRSAAEVYPIGGDWACPFIQTATANFSFIVQGDCSAPGCMIDGVRNPIPAEASSVAPTVMADIPTEAPSVAPTMIIDAPSQPPVSRERMSVERVSVVFTQSQQIPDDDLIVFEDIVGSWFESYYNSKQRSRHLLLGRSLQEELGVAGIHNMDSQITVTSQELSNVANVVEFNQLLKYDVSAAEGNTIEANDLILSPWRDDDYNQELASELALELPDSFENAGVRIPVPVIVQMSSTVDDDGEPDVQTTPDNDSWSSAVYALAVLIVISIAAIAYFVYRKRNNRAPPRKSTSENEVVEQEPAGVPSVPQAATPVRAQPKEPRSASSLYESPNYKDQCRTMSTPHGNNNPPLAEAVVVDSSMSGTI